jgi:uncharacterized membrane protein (DUF2068 family)
MRRTYRESGLKTIAVFEAVKGVVVLVAGFGLAALVHKDVEVIAERLVRHTHLNPASRYPRIFLHAAARLDDPRLVSLAALAFVYAVVRLAEAYGLWHNRAWAEWLGALSGALYVPIEAYHLWRHPTLLRVVILLGNLGVVAFLSQVLWRRRGLDAEPVSGPLGSATQDSEDTRGGAA